MAEEMGLTWLKVILGIGLVALILAIPIGIDRLALILN